MKKSSRFLLMTGLYTILMSIMITILNFEFQNKDLIYLSLISVIWIVSIFIISQLKDNQYHAELEKLRMGEDEEDVAKLYYQSNKARCNMDGKYIPEYDSEHKPYCSQTCSLIAFNRIYSYLATFLLLGGIFFPLCLIPGIGMLGIAIWGIEHDIPSYKYYIYVKNRNST